MSARDELALDVFLADNNKTPEGVLRQDWADAPDRHRPYAHNIADGLIAKGYTKPRTIAERYEDNGPDKLPPLSVVLSGGKPAIMQHDGTFMDHDGTSYDVWEMEYPLTVIHEPAAEAQPTNVDFAVATAKAAGVRLTEQQARDYIYRHQQPETEATA